MQQEFIEFKKRCVEKMKALKKENVRLKKSIQVEATIRKKKDKDVVNNVVLVKWTPCTLLIHKNEAKSKHHPTPKSHHFFAIGEKRHHPFIDGVTYTPLPKQWKLLAFDYCDGNIDSNAHVAIYVTQVSLYSTNDVVMCKAFKFFYNYQGAAL